MEVTASQKQNAWLRDEHGPPFDSHHLMRTTDSELRSGAEAMAVAQGAGVASQTAASRVTKTTLEELEAIQCHKRLVVAEDVRRLVDRAFSEVLPSAAVAVVREVLSRKRERVLPAQGSDCGPDLILRAASTVFKVMVACSRADNIAGVSVLNTGGLRVEVLTDSGAFRIREHPTGAAFARDLMSCVEGTGLRAARVYSFMVNDFGYILLTSRAHAVALNAQGLLQCSVCGKFFHGVRGLRDHQQVRHRRSYEDSLFCAKTAELALVDLKSVSLAQERDDEEARRFGLTKLTGSVAAVAEGDVGVRTTTAERGLLATKCGDLALLMRVVSEEQWDPSSSFDLDGSSAFEWAAGNGHLEVVRYLFETCGCNARSSNSKKGLQRTPLHWAARHGHTAVVGFLIDVCGALVDARMSDQSTPFHYAVYGASQACCAALASRGADVCAINDHGCNALQWAAVTGSVAMIDYLVTEHALSFSRSKNGLTLMHKAAQRGHAGVCRFLAEMYPEEEWFSPDNSGVSAIDVARINGHESLYHELQELYKTAQRCLQVT